jgi:hypothetical protein
VYESTVCQVSTQGKYVQAKNFGLGEKLEIMDAELIAAYQALSNLQSHSVQGEEIHVFIDSQAALKRLQNISLTGGQRVCYEIAELRRLLAQQNNNVSFFFFYIIYIALPIASINTMMLMQSYGLWSAAHAKHNPSFLGSTTWCYQLQSFTCVVL